jgi:hypothetical protein
LAGRVDAEGGRCDALKAEAVSGDDAIVQDVVDVRLGGQAAQGCGIVLGRGLDCSDAEVLVAPGEMGAGGGNAGFRVARDGGVAIEDEVAVRRDAGGVDLGSGETRQQERQDDCPFACAIAEQTSRGNAKS